MTTNHQRLGLALILQPMPGQDPILVSDELCAWYNTTLLLSWVFHSRADPADSDGFANDGLRREAYCLVVYGM